MKDSSLGLPYKNFTGQPKGREGTHGQGDRNRNGQGGIEITSQRESTEERRARGEREDDERNRDLTFKSPPFKSVWRWDRLVSTDKSHTPF